MICHPLHGICLLLSAIERHLENHEWISSTLTEELLPKNVRIVYKSGPADRTRDDALPIVAYNVVQIVLAPFMAGSSVPGTNGGTAAEIKATVTFTISTTNETLTNELACELGYLCMSLHKSLQAVQTFIGGVEIKGSSRTQSGYFEAATTVSLNLSRGVWQQINTDDILREIGMRIAIKG